MSRLNFLAALPLSIFTLNTGKNLMPVHLSVFSLVIQPTKRGISVTLPSLVKCTILWMSHSSKILLTTLILQFRERIASVNRSIGSGHHFSSQTHHSPNSSPSVFPTLSYNTPIPSPTQTSCDQPSSPNSEHD